MITSFFKPLRSKTNTSENKADLSQSLPSMSSKKGNKIKHSTKGGTNAAAKRSRNPPSLSASKRTKVTEKDNQDVENVSDSVPNKGSAPGQEILSNLTEDSWRTALAPHMASPSFKSLAKFIASERTNKTVYPPVCDIFSALNLVPLDKVRVVIVGQDPYHQPNQGHGLAFSVRKGERIPPSLRNIYKELMNDKDVNKFKMKPSHGYLKRWATKGGVLLLNSVLTVRRNEPNSHAKRGWELFTDEIIRILLSQRKEDSDTGSGLVFLLWGKPAGRKAENIINQVRSRSNSKAGKDKKNNPHVVICTSHPSPLGATKTDKPFLGSKCFSRANQALVQMGREPIDWRVDDDDDEADDMITGHKRKTIMDMGFQKKGKILSSDV